MALVQPLILVTAQTQNGRLQQEKSINRDYPFTDLHLESPEQYVVRTYLQCLWLPESIMPLTLLVPSLRRVQEHTASSPGSEHPLHALLEPLLLSTRSSSAKYHIELPRILANNGGAGEIEETTMWYALNYEKVGSGEGDEENGVQSGNSGDVAMMEDKWKNAWLERLERREVQIQILLYLLKLSLPGPSARRRKEKPITVIPSPAERLESFMDKLSTWQLISRMDDTHAGNATGCRHFARISLSHSEKSTIRMTRTRFKTTLPDMCKILRSKVFPRSPFADDNGGSDTDIASNRSSSPVPTSKPSTSKASKTKKERSKQDLHRSAFVSSTNRPRSLSISLAQDASTRRSNSGTSTTLKRALSREVSMSRTFKPRPTAAIKGLEDHKVTHVQPPDPTHRLAPKARKQETNMQGVTLVTATPTKLGRDEEIWLPDSSPDLILLRPREHTSSSSSCPDSFNNRDDDDSDTEIQTPVKKRMRL
ncbi:hypothetical protein EDC04DRAFT_2866669 [Pisolithus marmoratus]|nr:hypothetical protein EDC04DRAFT_2866669 [Pisolithus marmoratus]